MRFFCFHPTNLGTWTVRVSNASEGERMDLSMKTVCSSWLVPCLAQGEEQLDVVSTLLRAQVNFWEGDNACDLSDGLMEEFESCLLGWRCCPLLATNDALLIDEEGWTGVHYSASLKDSVKVTPVVDMAIAVNNCSCLARQTRDVGRNGRANANTLIIAER